MNSCLHVQGLTVGCTDLLFSRRAAPWPDNGWVLVCSLLYLAHPSPAACRAQRLIHNPVAGVRHSHKIYPQRDMLSEAPATGVSLDRDIVLADRTEEH